MRLARTCACVAVLLGVSTSAVADLPSVPLPPLPEQVTATIEIDPHVIERPVSPTFIGNNLHPGKPRETTIAEPAVQKIVVDMGVKTIRFPNGCIADLYNWQSPSPYTVSVDAFLAFCEVVGAEPYYTLNMQGGTEGLEGPPPKDAPLDEIIRYRHTAPNPCGYTNYHFDTLAESLSLLKTYTIQRALDGKLPIRHYELGNENWGQATTDWPPEVYGKTCEVYAAAMRQALDDARRASPGKLDDLSLYIVMVGYPSMGNNQDPGQAVNREINVRWTAEVNRLAGLGLIDAVQEHFYPYGNNNTSYLVWSVHNLHNILSLRYGLPNGRLGGYVDKKLAYNVPVEFTEWNVKCWGPLVRTDIPLINPGFESGLEGWTVTAVPGGKGDVKPRSRSARRGSAGALLSTGEGAQYVEMTQKFSVADRMPSPRFGAAVWIKTDNPLGVYVCFRQTNAGEHQGQTFGDRTATQTDMWERVVIGPKPFEDTKELELVIRVEGENNSASVDEVQPLHWPSPESGHAPLAADRFEQQLFIVDSLRELLLWPTPRTHLHHLFGNYPCPTMKGDGALRDNVYPFYLLKDRIGDHVVQTTCEVPTFDWYSYWPGATDFGASAPTTTGIPALSAVTTRRGDELYLLLVNRTTDRPIRTQINLVRTKVSPRGELRTLTGTDIDVTGANTETRPLKVSNPMSLTVPPYTAQVLSLTLQDAGVKQEEARETGVPSEPRPSGSGSAGPGATAP